jgi:hypothetical protein
MWKSFGFVWILFGLGYLSYIFGLTFVIAWADVFIGPDLHVGCVIYFLWAVLIDGNGWVCVCLFTWVVHFMCSWILILLKIIEKKIFQKYVYL